MNLKLIQSKKFSDLKEAFNNQRFEEFENLFIDGEKKNFLCENSYNLYGLYLVKKNKIDEAINVFQKSIQLNPDFETGKINLSGLYINYLHQLDEAKKIIKTVLNNNSDNKQANFLLAEIFFKQNDYVKAEEIFKKIIAKNPLDHVIYNKLGIVYYKIDKLDLSEENFKNAIQLNSNIFDYHYNLYLVYKLEKNFEKCETTLKSLIKKFPEQAVCYHELAFLYRAYGKFTSSDLVLENFLKKNNYNEEEAIYQLLSSPDYKNKLNLSNLIKKEFGNLENRKKEIIGYGFFKHYDYLNQYDKASDFLKQSLKLTEERLNYNIKVEVDQFNFLKKTFNKEFFLKNLETNVNNYYNLFIVGLHRSGSTLLEQMLTCNPLLKSFGEITYYPDLITKFYPNQQLDVFKDSISKSDKLFFKNIGLEYLNKIKSNEKFSIDKQLSNFRMIGFIVVTLPNSLIIHIKRNKNDNLFSILSNYYAHDHAPWSYSEKNLKIYYDYYLDLMDHWQKLLKDRIVNIEYEKLVENPKNELMKILDKISVKWDDSYLNFQKSKNAVYTQSIYQVRKKLYQSSVNRWKNYEIYFPELFKK